MGKPDILIPFLYNLHDLNPYAVIYVRPQTNKIKYEKAIILACQKYGEVVYLANIGGSVFIKNLLILEHYATQYYFAMHSKSIMEEYPEMIRDFEEYFNISFKEANIISPFDAQITLQLSTSELFNTMVDDSHFLKTYGQTIKRIGEYFVINYDIPEIIAKYNPEVNVFTIAVRFVDSKNQFSKINQAIFDNLKNSDSTPIIDENFYTTHQWFDKVRRTYHISKNHVAAMFDMKDFLFCENGNEIDFLDIPLGRTIIERNILTEEELLSIKRFSLVKIEDENGNEKLIDIQDYSHGMNIEETINLFSKIILSSIRT